jgi:membrane protein DedA with SNARE-associated domain/rhodanese-related sulfurtransferase
MADLGPLLVQYGYVLLVAFVLFEQLGLPLPAAAMMLVAGAMAGNGLLSFPFLFALALVACVVADTVWYRLGWRHGNRVIHLLCKLSLEPDDCARRTGDLYHRYGVYALVVAKFVPGLNTIAAPLAGLLRLRPHRFLFWDTVGASVWIGSMLGLGYIFADQLESAFGWVTRFGAGIFLVLLLLIAGYLALKIWIRRRFIAKLRTARISPEEVWERVRAGDRITVVDLRMGKDVEFSGSKLPGALQIQPEELAGRVPEIPKDHEVVLYCSCPNEATSARTAMRLQSKGVQRIRPLLGGFDGWVAAGLPVESLRAVRLGQPGPVLYSNDIAAAAAEAARQPPPKR